MTDTKHFSSQIEKKQTAWVEAFAVVNFDLEIGQKVDFIYPSTRKLHETQERDLAYMSFPDSNAFTAGDTAFLFKVRDDYDSPGPYRPSLHGKDFLYGYVYFRQKRDDSISRGYMQKSVVILTKWPFPALFLPLVRTLGHAYFDWMEATGTSSGSTSATDQGLGLFESAFDQMCSWPQPDIDSFFELPFLGTVFPFRSPVCKPPKGKTVATSTTREPASIQQIEDNPFEKSASEPSPPPPPAVTSHIPTDKIKNENENENSTFSVEEKRSGTSCPSQLSPLPPLNSALDREDGTAGAAVSVVRTSTPIGSESTLRNRLSGRYFVFQDVNICQTFKSLLNCLWKLWELVLIGEPVLILSPTPEQCSQAVLGLISLISPLSYAGDFRPYFTVHDSDFKLFAMSGNHQPFLPVILGVTNPFFVKSFDHYPHVLAIGKQPAKQHVQFTPTLIPSHVTGGSAKKKSESPTFSSFSAPSTPQSTTTAPAAFPPLPPRAPSQKVGVSPGLEPTTLIATSPSPSQLSQQTQPKSLSKTQSAPPIRRSLDDNKKLLSVSERQQREKEQWLKSKFGGGGGGSIGPAPPTPPIIFSGVELVDEGSVYIDSQTSTSESGSSSSQFSFVQNLSSPPPPLGGDVTKPIRASLSDFDEEEEDPTNPFSDNFCEERNQSIPHDSPISPKDSSGVIELGSTPVPRKPTNSFFNQIKHAPPVSNPHTTTTTPHEGQQHQRPLSLGSSQSMPQAQTKLLNTNKQRHSHSHSHSKKHTKFTPPPPPKGKPTLLWEFHEWFYSKHENVVCALSKSVMEKLIFDPQFGEAADAANNEVLRRHFMQLTEQFLQPLHMCFDLMWCSCALGSPFFSSSELSKYFPRDAFLDFVKKNGFNDKIFDGKKSEVLALYKKFIGSVNFKAWLYDQIRESQKSDVRHTDAKTLCEGKTKEELADLFSRVTQALEHEKQRPTIDELFCSKLETYLQELQKRVPSQS